MRGCARRGSNAVGYLVTTAETKPRLMGTLKDGERVLEP